MTEQEALRDLVSSEGWAYVKAYASAELAVKVERVLNASADTDPVVLGWQMKGYQLLASTVRHLLSWPEKRADELDARHGRSSRGVVVDARGDA